MKNGKISQDLWPVKNEKMRNFRDRIWFIKYWAEYIKNNPDKKWGRGQANLINPQMRSSKEFYKALKDKKGIVNRNR